VEIIEIEKMSVGLLIKVYSKLYRFTPKSQKSHFHDQRRSDDEHRESLEAPQHAHWFEHRLSLYRMIQSGRSFLKAVSPLCASLQGS